MDIVTNTLKVANGLALKKEWNTEKIAKESRSNNIEWMSSLASKRYKASFAGCPISDRALFSRSDCIIPISIMGRKQYEDQYFLAMMKLINSSFKSCTLLIVDSLYRHTLRVEHPEKNEVALHNMAMEAGGDWLKRNKKAYQELTIPYKVVRWDHYFYHTDFQRQYNIICHLYDTDQRYRDAIDTNAIEFLNRYLNRVGEVRLGYHDAFSMCIQYLKEECAGMCLWVEGGYHFEVYPTGRCPAMIMTYERLIKPCHPTLLRSVGIRYKKNASQPSKSPYSVWKY